MSAAVSSVVVMGVSGSGKTTLAAALAQRLKACFLDADNFHPIANVEKMRSGMPLNDEDRKPWLQSLNAELITRNHQNERVVLACSALKQGYRDVIGAGLHTVAWVFLEGSFEQIAARIRARKDHYMPASLLRSQFDALERPHGAIYVPITLEIEAAVDTVLAQLTAMSSTSHGILAAEPNRSIISSKQN